jgi:hypothetical protein
VTGEQLFLRYAFPCTDTPFGMIAGRKTRMLSPKHRAEILDLIKNNGQPRRSLLRFCYPYAFRKLREYAQKNGLERWALATVAEFWRHHHGHTGECSVRCAMVLNVSDDNTTACVAYQGEKFPVVNHYHLPLRMGQYVYVHLRMIAEVEGATT